MLIYILKVIGYEEWDGVLAKMATPDMTIHAHLGESIWDQVNEMFVECGKNPKSYDVNVVLFGHFGRKNNEFVEELRHNGLDVEIIPELV